MSGTRVTTETDDGHYAHPVRAVLLGPPSAAHLELIRAHLLDESILETNEPYVWQAQASNDREDAYGTRMHRSTLDNFAVDAAAGVAFMNSHRTGGFTGSAELPMGRTFEARVIGASATNPLRADITSYTLRGLNLNGLSTDAFIDGLRSGIARDVSVGFYGGTYRCSICDRDMLRDWECRHWPGREYPKLDSKGNPIEGETVRAVAWIHDAHLSELSVVYDGATPGAMVSKARQLAAQGEIKPETIDWLEQRYRTRLPHPARAHPGIDVPAPAREATTMLTDEQIAAVRLALVEAGAAPDADIVATVQGYATELRTLRTNATQATEQAARLQALETEVGGPTGLRALADVGRQYRTDLISEAITEGARALNKSWDEAAYRTILETAPLESIKRMRDDWARIAGPALPGGRLTADPAQRTNGHAPSNEIPAAAFSSR